MKQLISYNQTNGIIMFQIFLGNCRKFQVRFFGIKRNVRKCMVNYSKI